MLEQYLIYVDQHICKFFGKAFAPTRIEQFIDFVVTCPLQNFGNFANFTNHGQDEIAD